MNQKETPLRETELDAVAGGATVVEIRSEDMTPLPDRCFSCKSRNVVVTVVGSTKTITCRNCGAVDIIKL